MNDSIKLSESQQSAGSPVKHSHEIPVKHFEMTLVWPVLLEDGIPESKHETSPDYLSRITGTIINQSPGVWEDWNSPFPDPGSELQYSEWVYHHSFLRDAFYSSRADVEHHHKSGSRGPVENRNIRVLRRTDMAFVETAFDLFDPAKNESETVQLRLQIDDNRVLLYVFDTGVAMLVLTVKYDYKEQNYPPEKFTLRTVLRLQDVLRRCYAPYWSNAKRFDKPFHFAGHCPLELRLINTSDNVFESHFGNYYLDDQDAGNNLRRNQEERAAAFRHRAFIAEHREPYCVEMWRKLMEPLVPRTIGGPKNGALQFEQILDDRLPILSYIAVPNPRQISPGDWRRLAAIDEEGKSDCFPYSPSFVTDEYLATFAYDRFWHPTATAPSQDWFDTRWLCSGYGFTGVGSSFEGGFFTDTLEVARGLNSTITTTCWA